MLVNAAFQICMQAKQTQCRPYFEERLRAIDKQLAGQ
jgi:hypothetical protein